MKWSYALAVVALGLLATAPTVFRLASAQDSPSGPDAEGAASVAAKGLDDGPYLFHAKDGGVVAKWVQNGEVKTRRFDAGEPVEMPEFAHLLGMAPTAVAPAAEPSVWEQPDRLLVVSDVEGQYDDLRRFLIGNGVVAADGGWTFGTGHLVCVGDMVDRGTQVTETLWLLHRLAREAEAAGGHVHHVLGNHEAMLMGGDVRYVAPKYHAVAKLLGVPCEGLVGADTELGRWLRTRNSVVRIGEYVFVHAGIAPGAALGEVDLDALNGQIRGVLGTPPKEIAERAALERVWGRQSVLWYRGYFPQFAGDFGRTPSLAELDRVLASVGGKTIVVGHTKVAAVTPMHGGRVVAIDIPWTAPERVRGLLIGAKSVDVVDIHGERTRLALPSRE